MLVQLALLAQSATPIASAPPIGPASQPVVLPFAVDAYFEIGDRGRTLGFLISEVDQGPGGTDLNSDGDTSDDVFALLNRWTGEVTVTDLDVVSFQVADGFVALVRRESDSGVDVTGDGFIASFYVTIYDIASGVEDTWPLAIKTLGEARGDIATFELPIQTGVSGIYSHSLGQRRLLGTGATGFAVRNDRWIYSQREWDAGVDLNGDGDLFDNILGWAGISPAQDMNLGVTGSFAIDVTRDRIVFNSFESNENIDANGDGDLFDRIIHSADLSTGQVRILGTPSSFLGSSPRVEVAGDAVYFRQSENGIGDLNGDGDELDRVLVAVDARTGVRSSLGVEGTPIAATGRQVTFAISEQELGVDASGNGTINEAVVDIFDRSTNQPMGLNQFLPLQRVAEMNDRYLVMSVAEYSDSIDLNGDGDALDQLIEVRDLVRGTRRVLPHNVFSSLASLRTGETITYVASEYDSSADINGDGDQTDAIVMVHHFSSGTTINTGAERPFEFRSDRFGMAFVTLESFVGLDLNGDGDASDRVLYVSRR